MYARKRDSGLGLPQLSMLVPLGHLRDGKSLTLVDDILVQETVNTLFSKLNSIAGSLVSSSPLSFAEIHLLKRRLKNEEGTRWSQRVPWYRYC